VIWNDWRVLNPLRRAKLEELADEYAQKYMASGPIHLTSAEHGLMDAMTHIAAQDDRIENLSRVFRSLQNLADGFEEAPEQGTVNVRELAKALNTLIQEAINPTTDDAPPPPTEGP
jgi:flagellar biosynthesis/type III secretory pathway protein FliH